MSEASSPSWQNGEIFPSKESRKVSDCFPFSILFHSCGSASCGPKVNLWVENQRPKLTTICSLEKTGDMDQIQMKK